MQTILGAGGAIGIELAKELGQKGERVRLVGRHPKLVAGAVEVICADVADLNQTIAAVSGSTVVHLLVGLKYDHKIWRHLWPRIMRNTVEACKRTGAKLIFFDNVYMYGRVVGPMTEVTPFKPCRQKGEIRAQIATILLEEMKAGWITALIARAADFYGPGARTGMPNALVFDKFAKNGTASWLVNDAVRHSYSFTPDAAKSLALLAGSEKSWNQTWHLPTTSNPPTGKEFIEMAARAFGVRPKYRVLRRPLIKLAGLFDPVVREIYEMLYQNDSEYLFDSTKFAMAFEFEPTPYDAGIHTTARAANQRLT